MDDAPKSSVEWRCIRCKAIFPSPDGSGRPPSTCLQEVGGCGRSTDPDDENGATKFYPSDWSDAKTELYFRASVSEGGNLFRETVEMWNHYIEFADPDWHPKLLTLFVFQSYFFQSLPAVYYSGLTGPAGSAKTTVLEILKALSYNGIQTGNASVAAVARKLHEGCTFLFDESDEMDSEKRDLIYAAARQGYRPGSVYLRYDYKKKGYEEVNIYGPKAFAFISGIEDALRSRTIEIPTIRVKDNPFQRVLDNLARPLDPFFRELGTRIAAFCGDAIKRWTPATIYETLIDETFRKEVSGAVGTVIRPRDIELAAIALLIAKIADVDIAPHVRTALEAQGVFESEEATEMLAYLRAWPRDGSYALVKDIRDGLNHQRKENGEKPVHHKRFRALLRDVGLREGEELKRLPRDGRHVLVYTPQYMALIASPDGLPPQKDASPPPSGWFTTPLDSSPHGEASGGMVKNQEETVKELHSLGEAIGASKSGGEEGCFTADELASKTTISKDDIDRWLKHWSEKGVVYRPRGEGDGRYKFA